MEVNEDPTLDNHIMLITGNVIDGQDLDMLGLPAILNSEATADELQVQPNRKASLLVARSANSSVSLMKLTNVFSTSMTRCQTLCWIRLRPSTISRAIWAIANDRRQTAAIGG